MFKILQLVNLMLLWTALHNVRQCVQAIGMFNPLATGCDMNIAISWFVSLAVCSSFIIGINHDFLCVNICWAPRKVLKPELERWGFPADVNVSENHVCLLLLHRNILSLENILGNVSNSSFFPVLIGTLGTASNKANNNFLTSRNYVCYCARYWWWHKIL